MATPTVIINLETLLALETRREAAVAETAALRAELEQVRAELERLRAVVAPGVAEVVEAPGVEVVAVPRLLTAPAGSRIRFRRNEDRFGVWTGERLELEGARVPSVTRMAKLLRGDDRPINGWDFLQVEVDGVWRPIAEARTVPPVARPRGAAAAAAAAEEE
jgi:hypothetical protein